MNIAIDFLTLHQPTGAGEYIRRIFYGILNHLKNECIENRNIYALFDSSLGVFYQDMNIESIQQMNVKAIDIAKYASVAESLKAHHIDTFFVGCAQYLGKYSGLEDITCRVICVIHDLSYEENYFNNIQPFQVLNHRLFRQDLINEPKGWFLFFKWRSPTMRYIRWYYFCRSRGIWEKDLVRMENVMKMVRHNPQTEVIAVSEYTKNSIVYNFGIPSDRVSVLFSPERIFNPEGHATDSGVRELIGSNRKFYLLVSAGRLEKNAYKAIRAFEKFASEHQDKYLVTIGFKETLFKNHIDFGFLDDTDLALCYAHCYALLYPSFFEGFGYPPIEAMHYSKPVLCSNVCSMPEILKSAPIYFSPLYISDIYRALNELTEANYHEYSERSRTQYLYVRNRQEADLIAIIKKIIG